MNTPDSDPRQKRIEQATSRRLAKLGSVPLELTRLRAAVTAEQSSSKSREWRAWPIRVRPLRAAAASLLIVGLIAALVVHSSSGPALASAEQLARIHDEVLVGTGEVVTPVHSVEAVNATLARQVPGLPAVPNIPQDHITSCCAHTLDGKRMACVRLEVDNVPVTLAVAASADIRTPDARTLSVAGNAYHIQSHGDVNMVIFQRDNRWMCLMSRLPVERLTEIARSLGQ